MQRHLGIRRAMCLVSVLLFWSSAAVWAAEPLQNLEDDASPAIPLEGARWQERGEPRGPAQAVKASDFFLGVECQPLPEAIAAQLKLPQGEGLLVEQIFPDSPAVKAGIQRFDVLLRAGDKPLKTVADLVAAVDAGKGGKLALAIIRAGKSITVDATPVQRPADLRAPGIPSTGFAEWDDMRNWLERARPGEGGRPPLRFRFFQPGAMLPPGAATFPPLPENVTIAVTRQGHQPAKIQISRGEQKWEVTENELDTLPADLRPHVERMLGRGAAGLALDYVPAIPVPVPAASPKLRAPRVEPAPPANIEKRLDEMNRQLEDLRRSLEELRGKQPAQKR
jgi:hypothetical protein